MILSPAVKPVQKNQNGIIYPNKLVFLLKLDRDIDTPSELLEKLMASDSFGTQTFAC